MIHQEYCIKNKLKEKEAQKGRSVTHVINVIDNDIAINNYHVALPNATFTQPPIQSDVFGALVNNILEEIVASPNQS